MRTHMTAREAAKMIGCKPQRLLRWCWAGHIPYVMLNRQTMVLRSTVQALLSDRAVWPSLPPRRKIVTKQSIANRRFGKLVAVAPIGKTKSGHVWWECRCDCGKTKIAPSNNLLHNMCLHCGCDRRRPPLPKVIEAFGQRRTVKAWAAIAKIREQTLIWRLRSGMSPAEAISRPVRTVRRRARPLRAADPRFLVASA